MKTLKLPGLDDTYTFLQNDTTLTQSGKAADAKTTGDALAAVQAQVDGVQAGQYPEMGAGQLLSTTGTANPTPYTYRENVSGGDRVTISQITGGTVAFNQLASMTPGSATSKGITRTVNADGTVSFSGTADSAYTWNIQSSSRTGVAGHVILLRGCPSGGSTEGYRLQDGSNTTASRDFGDGRIYAVTHSEGKTVAQIAIQDGATVTDVVFTPQYFDLTQMFGATVAQHFLDLETSTAGAGVALFREMFPASYYPYNAGELVSAQTSGRVSGDHTYPLDSTITLRGVPVLTDGVPAYDGDKYEPTGTVTRRYGIVDLGTLGWSLSGTANVFYATLTGISGGTTGTFPHMLCPKYSTGMTAGNTSTDRGDGYIWNEHSNPRIRIHDSGITATDQAGIQAALSGVYLVYEFATSTTETAVPYQEIQIVGSTEEFLPPASDTRPVAVPVGSQSLYQTNLRAGLEALLNTDLAHAESIAPVQGGTASTNIASGELLMRDGKLYQATQAIVAGAEIVPGTNATQTSVADVFKPTVYQLTSQGTGVTLDTTVSNIKVFPVYGFAVLTVKFTVSNNVTSYLAFASCTDVRPNIGLGSDDGISIVVANANATRRITLVLRPNGWMRVYPADTTDNAGTYYATVVYPV